MVCDLLQGTPDPSTVWDVCVIGAGAAGIVLAKELVRCGFNVLLLEGGGATLEEAAQEPYRSEISGLPHRGIHNGRFRAQGGTTTRWGGQILELDDIDFQKRSWIPGSGWPFPKSALDSFYQRALELEGLDNSIALDRDVWKAMGETIPSLPDLQSYLSRWCPEPDFARLHSDFLTKHPNVQVWLHANATELTFQAEMATGIRACSQAGTEVVFHAQKFVFCMGAIESSRFFLQPRTTYPWRNLPLLGRHFQDHIDCNVAQLQPHSPSAIRNLFDGIFLRGFKYQPKIKLDAREQSRAGILNVAATLAFQSDLDEPLAAMRNTAKNFLRGRFGEMQPKDALQMIRHSPSFVRQTYRYAVQHRSYQPRHAKISLRVHCEQEPCSLSSIALSHERDSLGMFRTKLSWKISSLELKTIRRFTEVATASLAGVARLLPKPDLNNDAALIASSEDSFHHMGGMRMGHSPSQGVVDFNLKVHSAKNVWVCSTAVFPTSGFSNPTHTLIALAVRLSEHLSGT